MELLKPVYLTKNAQALTEFAIFGGMLLLVLSFFLSYAVRMDYSQNLKLKAFRMALSEAYDPSDLIPDRPDNASVITLYEDRHVPDPRNIAARGSYSTVGANAAVIWGDSVGRAYDGGGNLRRPYTTSFDYSRMKLIVNGQVNDFMTEDTNIFYSNLNPAGVWVNLDGVATNKAWNELHCYQPAPSMEKRVNVRLDPSDPNNLETLLVTEVGLDLDASGGIEPHEWLQFVRIDNEDAVNDGDPINALVLKGAALTMGINPYHLDINYIKQYENNNLNMLEGVLLAEDSKVNRQQITGTFIETTGVYTSQVQYNLDGTRTVHKLRRADFLPPKEIVFEPAKKNGAFAWRTQPKAR